PERKKVTEEMLSEYSKDLLTDLGLKHHPSPKLVPNLRNKTKYILHYRNLKLYTELGMEISKIHRVLKFRQEPWLKKYIDFNTSKRQSATSDFEKDFYKLMSNSVFGKTMENIRKHRNIKVLNNRKKLIKLIASPAYHDRKIFDEDLVAVQMVQVSINLSKPIYAGLSILDLSKLLMYD